MSYPRVPHVPAPAVQERPGLSFRTYVMAVVGFSLLLATLLVSLNVSGPSMAEGATADTDGVAVERVASSSVRGTCATFGNGTFACAPSKTPKGSPIVRLYEDGSATYKNDAVYDSDSGRFDAR